MNPNDSESPDDPQGASREASVRRTAHRSSHRKESPTDGGKRRRSRVLFGASLLAALASYVHFDPAAPPTPWTTVSDPDPFASPEGRRVVEDVYLFEASDPWRVHTPDARRKYREHLVRMKSEWGERW